MPVRYSGRKASRDKHRSDFLERISPRVRTVSRLLAGQDTNFVKNIHIRKLPSMRKLSVLVIVVCFCATALTSCSNAGGSPLVQTPSADQSLDAQTKASIAEILAMVDPTKMDLMIATLTIKSESKNGPIEPWIPVIEHLLNSRTAQANPDVAKIFKLQKKYLLLRIEESKIESFRSQGNYAQAYQLGRKSLEASIRTSDFEVAQHRLELTALINDAERAGLWSIAIKDRAKLMELVKLQDPKDPQIAVMTLHQHRTEKLAKLTAGQLNTYWEAFNFAGSDQAKYSPQALRKQYERIEKAYANVLGIDSLDRLNARLRLADLDVADRANEEAIRSYREVIAGKERLLGKSHADVISLVRVYVALLSRVDRHEEALAMLKTRIENFDLDTGNDKDRIKLEILLSSLHGAMKQYDLAIALNTKIAQQWPSGLTISASDYEILYHDTGKFLELTGDPKAAIQWYVAYGKGLIEHSKQGAIDALPASRRTGFARG